MSLKVGFTTVLATALAIGGIALLAIMIFEGFQGEGDIASIAGLSSMCCMYLCVFLISLAGNEDQE